MSYFKSSIGAKHIMAVTGLLMVLFLVSHLIGNLLIFAGQDAMNGYAVGLRELGSGSLIWVARLGLIAIVVLHIAAATRLVIINKAARPVPYRVFKPVRSPFYARVMPWTGVIILAYIIYHLMHFTFGVVQPGHFTMVDSAGRHDVYNMVIAGFQHPAVVVSYVLATSLLCFHMAHGIPSFFQSLGLTSPKYQSKLKAGGIALSIFLILGFISIPVACLTGILQGV